jgi:2-polyprenyl-3-methyl-5-hydroxy-6-metoxy-1,4-benzoquinol methylase
MTELARSGTFAQIGDWCAGRASYRIFSNEWHGVDLLEVARDAGISPTEVANQHFYEHLYRQWKARSFKGDPGWVAAKAKLAQFYRDHLTALTAPDASLLSVGAGLGLIEEQLLTFGFRVDLQECQSESLDPARFHQSRIWVSSDLRPITSGPYDALLALSVVYVFDDTEYARFATECRRLLRPGGVLIISDHDPCWPLSRVKQFANRVRGGPRQLLWGWLRSPKAHATIVQGQGFRLCSQRFLNHDQDEIAAPFRMCGLQMPRGSSVAQVLTFRAV